MVHENDVLSFPVRYELVKRLVKGCDSWANKLDNAESSHRTWSKTVEERLNFRIGRNTKRRSFVCFRHSPQLEFRSEQESTVFTIAVTIQNGIADARRVRLNSKLHGVFNMIKTYNMNVVVLSDRQYTAMSEHLYRVHLTRTRRATRD